MQREAFQEPWWICALFILRNLVVSGCLSFRCISFCESWSYREEGRERCFFHCFTPPTMTMSSTRPGWGQELLLGLPRECRRQALRPSSTLLPRELDSGWHPHGMLVWWAVALPATPHTTPVPESELANEEKGESGDQVWNHYKHQHPSPINKRHCSLVQNHVLSKPHLNPLYLTWIYHLEIIITVGQYLLEKGE